MTKKSFASSTRPSQGIRSPAARSATSPGTISASGISRGLPSRSTCPRTATDWRRLFRCLSGPVFLDEIEGHADEDDGADDEEAGGVAGESGEGAGGKENDDQGVAEFGQKLQDQRLFALPMDKVGAESGQPESRLSAAQPVRACGQLFQERCDGELPEWKISYYDRLRHVELSSCVIFTTQIYPVIRKWQRMR